MIKKLGLCALLASAALLSGCASTPAYQLMGPVKSDASSNFHSHKNAILYWDYGNITGTFAQNHKAAALGLLGMAVDAAIQSDEEQSDTNELFLKYGKAEQVVFMTSLRDLLQNQGAFQSVVISVAPKPLTADQVLISINFKKSIVSSAEDGYPIKLDVVLTIYGPSGKEFTKEFVVERKSSLFGGWFSGFDDAQADVSKRLMTKIINAINLWYLKQS